MGAVEQTGFAVGLITLKTTRLTYRYEPWREVYLENRGWTRTQDIRVGDRTRDYNGSASWATILEVTSEEPIEDLRPPGQPWWERLG